MHFVCNRFFFLKTHTTQPLNTLMKKKIIELEKFVIFV